MKFLDLHLVLDMESKISSAKVLTWVIYLDPLNDLELIEYRISLIDKIF